MPDPLQLRVGDRVRFVSLPEEWNAPEFQVHAESAAFMKRLIARGRSSRVYRLDEDGLPWIEARLTGDDGAIEYHDWGIRETTGWKRVVPRR